MCVFVHVCGVCFKSTQNADTSGPPIPQNDMSVETYTEIAKSCSYIYAPIQQI